MGALKNASEDGRQHERRVVIAGSLYLVGDVLRLLRQVERGGQTEET